MSNARPPVRLRLKEVNGEWRMEADGVSIVAPFPLTNELPGTPEYDIRTQAAALRFTEQVLSSRPHLPPEMLRFARSIAAATECGEIPHDGYK